MKVRVSVYCSRVPDIAPPRRDVSYAANASAPIVPNISGPRPCPKPVRVRVPQRIAIPVGVGIQPALQPNGITLEIWLDQKALPLLS